MAKAGGTTVQSPDLDKFIKKLGKLPAKLRQVVDSELGAAALDLEDKAQSDAPVDLGRLRSSISHKQNGEMDWEVVAGVFYAPYVEWGTRSKVNVPDELKEYAQNFQRSRGDEPGGMPARPFFFNNFYVMVPKVEKAIVKAVVKAIQQN